MKKYTVNVHYDYVGTVEVEAENEQEALELGRIAADNLDDEELEYCSFIGSCIVNS